ncbi:MAG: transcriptional repressor, partial [Alphaproteobacteria bacterium]|nr:transcriptional repressor [Alphaproteobacteria bacterium]
QPPALHATMTPKTPAPETSPAPLDGGAHITELSGLLEKHGIRPTRRRVCILAWLFPHGATRVVHRHYSAEDIHRRARKEGVKMSLATVYNTLNQFSRAGILKRVVAGQGHSFYDTNTSSHHHVFYEDTAQLEDVTNITEALRHIKKNRAHSRNQRIEIMVRVAPRTGPNDRRHRS